MNGKKKGRIAALVGVQMNGLVPFVRTTEQAKETMPPAPKQLLAKNNNNCKLTRAATLLMKRY